MSHRHPAARARLIAALLLGALGATASIAQPEPPLVAAPEAPLEAAPEPPLVAAPEAPAGPVEAAPRPRQNVLKNGDFEALEELLAPIGWHSARAASFDLIEDDADNRYGQLEAKGDDAARRIFRRLALDARWKTLRVTARLKAVALRIGDKPWRDAHIVLSFYDQDDKILKFTRPIALTASSAWKPFAGHETIPPGSHHCEIEIANYAQAGVLGVDDVKIEPDGLLEAPLLRPGFPLGRFEILERGELGDQPAGWPIEGLEGIALAQELAQEGANHFLRFTNEDAKGHVRIETIWRLKPGARALKVSARMRVRELRMGEEFWQTARVGLTFTNALGVDVAQGPPGLQLSMDSAWRTVSQTFEVPPDARFLKIMPELMQARGTLDVDDIQVEQLP